MTRMPILVKGFWGWGQGVGFWPFPLTFCRHYKIWCKCLIPYCT